jgi:hypothetical protein
MSGETIVIVDGDQVVVVSDSVPPPGVADVADAVAEARGYRDEAQAVLTDPDFVAVAASTDEINALAARTSQLDDLGSRTAEIDALAGDKAVIDAVGANIGNVNLAAANMLAIIAAPGNAAAAAASRAAIDDRLYPGTYAVAPATRPDGSAMQDGDRYINSTDGYEYIRVGGAWTNAGVPAQSALVSAAAAVVAANQASVSSVAAGAYPAAYAAALPRGVTAIVIGSAGTGGAPGTYAGGVVGGPTGFAWTYTIGAGGTVTAAAITQAGLSTATAAPVLSFPSGGLAGAPTATATVSPLVPTGRSYWALNSTGMTVQLYQNDGTNTPALVPGAALDASLGHEPEMAKLRHREDLNAYTVAAGNLTAENRQRRSLMNLRGVGAANADGTFTVPANDYIMSELYNTSGTYHWPGDVFDPSLFWDLWVAAADPTVAPDLTISVRASSPTSITTGNALTYTPTQVAPGVYKLRFRNSNDGVTNLGAFAFFIKNNAASAIKVFLPVVTLNYLTAPPVFDTFVDQRPVLQPRILSRDWFAIPRTDLADRRRSLKRVTTTLANTGNNAAAGTPYAPKQTFAGGLAAQLAADTVVGLTRGSLWREKLPLKHSSASINGVEIQDVSATTDNLSLPKVTPFDTAANASFVNNGDGTYSYTWIAEATVADNGYENVWVLEINTATEATTPLASTVRMPIVASQAAAAAAAGSAFIQSLGASQWKATLRPSDSLAPGTGTYRYEVVARFAAWEATSSLSYDRDLLVSGVHVVAGSFGYGVPLPMRTVLDRCVVEQGSTHGSVAQGGVMQYTLHYGRGDADGLSHVFYCGVATGKKWVARNGWMIGPGIGPDGFYSHTDGVGGVSDWAGGLIENYVFIKGRLANGALEGTAFSAQFNKNVEVRDVYVDGWYSGYDLQAPTLTASSVKNALLRRCAGFFPSQASTDSFVYTENFADPNNVGNRNLSGVFVRAAGSSTRRHTIHAKYVDQGNGVTDNAFMVVRQKVTGTALSSHDFSYNLVVVDTTGQLQMCGFTGAQPAATRDFNCYVLVNYSGVFIGNNNLGGNPQSTFALYQAATGWDTNSLWIDLRNDPRGVKALWVDPANGDYRYAQTEVARKVAAYCAANRVGCPWTISEWPSNPTADEQYRRLAAA